MKIHEYNEMMAYLTRPARVGFKRGTNFNRNPSGINQWVMRTDAEIQAIIDNPKYEGWTKKDFRGETKRNNIKILSKTETERPGLKFPHKGKTADPSKKRIAQEKRTKWVKEISDITTEQKLAGPKKSGLELSHLGSKTALATPNNLAYLPKYTNKLSYFRFEKILNDIQADQRRILADNKMTMDAKRKALAELAKADRTLRNRFKGLDYDKIKSRIKTKAFAWGIGEKEVLKDPTITIGKGETGANIALKTASKAEKSKVVAMGKDALNNFLKAEKEIKTLLNSADGPTITAIRSALKCGGLAKGGNLLECPMAKFAQDPEGTLNAVGRAVPETRTPIMNAFKKLGMGTLKWGGRAFIGLTPVFAGMEIKEASEKFEEGQPTGQIVADVIGNWVLPGVGGGYKTYQKRKMAKEVASSEELAAMEKEDKRKWYEMLEEDPLKEADYSKQLEESEMTDEEKLNLLNLKKKQEEEEALRMRKLAEERAARPLPEIDPFQAAEGGRVGFDKGSKPKSPGRRAFLKGITALAALPIVGKYFKLGKVLEKAQPYLGPTVEKIKGMPEWFPGLVKKLWNEGEDVTKQVAYKERQVVKRGTLEGGDDVDMIYDMDTGDVSIQVTPKTGKYETKSGAYNKEYELDYVKGQADETTKGKKPPDEFSFKEIEGRMDQQATDVDWDVKYTTVDDAMTDLTELEAFAKDKTTKQIHKKKGTKPKDVFPDYDPY